MLEAMEKGATRANLTKSFVRASQGAEKDRLLGKANGRCECCDAGFPDDSILHLHHVVPVQRGGTNAHKNVALLCPNCHAMAHYHDRTLAPADRPEGRLELLVLLKSGATSLRACHDTIREARSA